MQNKEITLFVMYKGLNALNMKEILTKKFINMDITKNDSEFLHSLLTEPTPTSYETPGLRVWDAYMEDLGLKQEYKDKMGNSGWSIGCGCQKVLISAHIDEIGMAVQDISEDGYITLVSLGGIDPKVLPGAQVMFLGSRVKGVFCKAPIHSEHQSDKLKTVLELKDLKVSVGGDSREEVEALGIEIGTLAVLARNINVDFGENKIHSNALDDKIGVYIISQIAKKLKEESDIELRHKYTFIFLAGTQEEAGLRGLRVAAHNINPDLSIDIDVTPALDGECGVDKNSWGNIKLGQGCVIEYGPDKSRRIAGILKEYAKANKLPFQSCVSRAGGTNTSAIQMSSSDCETMLVSIPNINMHTQNEICDWRDITSAIEILAGVIKENLI